jgi:hypothetical protein
MRRLLPFTLVFFACTTEPQEGCGKGFTEINSQCYHEGDLRILQKFIDNSNGSITATLDADSSDSIEPLELQFQKWNDQGRLHYLWLYDRSLSGAIPDSIGELTFLDTLNLSFNSLSGSIPQSIGNLKNLNWLYIYVNELSGLIPDSLCTIYSNLDHFQMFQNNLCPPYPACIPEEKIGPQITADCN